MYPPPKEVKHIACSRCRERKVRCDGEKPSCRRCERHGQTCEYVQGKKQQVKSEWVQHLRTFSAQPGKPKGTPVPRCQASSFSDPRSSCPSSYFPNKHSSQGTRSPSPCFPAVAAPVSGATMSVSQHALSRVESSSVNTWNIASAPTPPLIDDGLLDPALFAFTSTPMYCGNDYQSEYLNMGGNGYIGVSSSRSSTPFSQASEQASFDGYSTVSLPSSSYIPQDFISTSIPSSTGANTQTWDASGQYLKPPMYYQGTGYTSDF
ncbi:hypothetical protein P154DRAFT_567250 [Amniculicola lignicola CBS 123094]|uniref:Zn(2)-C6 fungal-type domain-containing protein n=1 Tax=Amniculicola lignicola CBS 123094 TaxID=1392246 RepID=A0A6A5W0V2_9PLEO|nr:hypothetical protein P154DRAFT_567250 [Amniculicola lignicola CBS 123094]